MLAFALGGVSLMGLPPSGAYLAKKLLFEAVAQTGQWWWELVMQAGGFFTASYVLLVLAHALWPADEVVKPRAPVPRLQEAAALALAVCSMLLGLAAIGPVPLDTLSLAPKELWSAFLLLIGGGVLVIGLVPRLPLVSAGHGALASPVRRATVAAAELLEGADSVLRRWPVAGLSLLTLVIMFVWSLL
jgi:NADH:ubiquinone oxidoreductase subunit 5 (subunit L)/multisubunit Na+/H+ antiporter MnhA subunit